MKKALLVFLLLAVSGLAHAQSAIPEESAKLAEWFNRVYNLYKEGSNLGESGKFSEAITKLTDSTREAEGYLANFKDAQGALNLNQLRVKQAIQNLHRDTLLATAATYEKATKLKEAEDFYKTCIKADEEYYLPYQCLANMLYSNAKKGSLTELLKVIDSKCFILSDDDTYQLAGWNAYCENREIAVRHLQLLFDRGYDIIKTEKDANFQSLSRYFKYEELLARAKEDKEEREDARLKLLQKEVADIKPHIGYNIADARVHLIDFLIERKKLKEAEEQIQEMEKDIAANPALKSYIYFQLASYSCQLDKLDKALECIKKYKETIDTEYNNYVERFKPEGEKEPNPGGKAILRLLGDKHFARLYPNKEFQEMVLNSLDTNKLETETYLGKMTLYELSALYLARGDKEKVYQLLTQLNKMKFDITPSATDKRFAILLPEKNYHALISDNVRKLQLPDPFSGKPVVIVQEAPPVEKPTPTPTPPPTPTAAPENKPATEEKPADDPNVPKETPSEKTEKAAPAENAPPAEAPGKTETPSEGPKREATEKASDDPTPEPEKKEGEPGAQ